MQTNSSTHQLYPDHITPLDISITVTVPHPLGVTAKIYLHEIARKLPSYNMPIQCDTHGVDKEGKTIAVNSLGRWLFGVPGFQENIRVVADKNQVIIFYAKQAPNSVPVFLQQLKEAVENKKTN